MAHAREFTEILSAVRHALFPDRHPRPTEPIEARHEPMARAHQVAAMLAATFAADDPREFARRLRDHRAQSAVREAWYLAEVSRIRVAFAGAGIPAWPLKAMALAPAYPRRGLRPFRDADLLVRASDVRAAHEWLVADGFRPLRPDGPLAGAPRNLGDAVAACAAGIDALGYEKSGFNLEVHTTILPPMLGMYPVAATGMDDAETLAHLFFHATRHHFLFGLRQLADIAVWVERRSPDLGAVREKLRATGTEGLAWPAWRLAHRYFPEIVPEPNVRANRIARWYAARANAKFDRVPEIAVRLAGSPIPCLGMVDARWRKITEALRGSPARRAYQGIPSGETARITGIARRHAGIVFRWIRFFL